MKLSGAQITIETLIEQGTKFVFGYPGGQVINLYDAIYEADDRIHHVLTAHEQGASHAADGYARSSGGVGVVIATSHKSCDGDCHGLFGFCAVGGDYRKCTEFIDWKRQFSGSGYYRHYDSCDKT